MNAKNEQENEINFELYEELSSVTDEDRQEGVLDEYGALYSKDGKRLLEYRGGSHDKYVIREGTEVICDYAFDLNHNHPGMEEPVLELSEIVIPSTVVIIGFMWFYGGYTKITVAEGNKFYDSRNGCNAIIETATNTLIRGCANTIIPESVECIGYRAFYGSEALKTIKIPASVEEIDECAFENCEGLTTITVAEGNKFYDSRNGCNAIIETATNTLILGCVNTKIPESVEIIGVCAFRNCFELTNLDIPNSVKYIGDCAFEGAGLTRIIIPNSVKYIGDCAFYGCCNLTNIHIPDSVKYIGDCAFTDCIELSHIEIPNSVTFIGYRAFEFCKNLTSIIIPDSVERVKGSVFDYCKALTSIAIQSPTTNVSGLGICNHSKNLKAIFIPEGSLAHFNNQLPDYESKLLKEIDSKDMVYSYLDKFAIDNMPSNDSDAANSDTDDEFEDSYHRNKVLLDSHRNQNN